MRDAQTSARFDSARGAAADDAISWMCMYVCVYWIAHAVFSSSAWVGTKEDNPTEKELPMPDSLTKKLHDAKNFGDAIAAPVKDHGADANDTDVNKDDEKQSKPPESPIVLD